MTDRDIFKCRKCGFEWFNPQKTYDKCPEANKCKEATEKCKGEVKKSETEAEAVKTEEAMAETTKCKKAKEECEKECFNTFKIHFLLMDED